MNFSDAVMAMIKGAHMIRSAWRDQKFYLLVMPKEYYIWRIDEGGMQPQVKNYLPSIDDIQASDWVILS